MEEHTIFAFGLTYFQGSFSWWQIPKQRLFLWAVVMFLPFGCSPSVLLLWIISRPFRLLFIFVQHQLLLLLLVNQIFENKTISGMIISVTKMRVGIGALNAFLFFSLFSIHLCFTLISVIANCKC